MKYILQILIASLLISCSQNKSSQIANGETTNQEIILNEVSTLPKILV
jgi:hypothetical protein